MNTNLNLVLVLVAVLFVGDSQLLPVFENATPSLSAERSVAGEKQIFSLNQTISKPVMIATESAPDASTLPAHASPPTSSRPIVSIQKRDDATYSQPLSAQADRITWIAGSSLGKKISILYAVPVSQQGNRSFTLPRVTMERRARLNADRASRKTKQVFRQPRPSTRHIVSLTHQKRTAFAILPNLSTIGNLFSQLSLTGISALTSLAGIIY